MRKETLNDFDVLPEELGAILEWCKWSGLGNLVGLLNAIATDRIVVLPLDTKKGAQNEQLH